MKYGVRSGEMAALLAGVLAAQWFSSTAAGFVDACGNAVVLAILPAGLALAGLAAVSCALAPERGLLTVCAVQKGMKTFALVAAALFLLLAGTALRDALSMLSLTLLPRTPRWCAMLFVLPVLAAIGFLGTASVSRAVRLLAPVFLGVYLVVLVLVYIILNKTKLGRHIYAIGGNQKAAEFSGINVKNTRLFVYTFSGIMGALAGIVLAARSYCGAPTAGNGAEMDAIEAAVLGGCSMAGGYGFIGGTIIGALIIGVMNNGLNLMRIDSYWQMIAKGVIVLIAVYVDYIKNLKKNQKAAG